MGYDTVFCRKQLLTFFSDEPHASIFSIYTLKILAAASTKHLYLPTERYYKPGDGDLNFQRIEKLKYHEFI